MSSVTELPPILTGEENFETPGSPRPSIRSGQNLENIEINKSPDPSIKSVQGLENTEEKKSPNPSIKSGEGVVPSEAEKSPVPSIKSGQGVENVDQEAKKTPPTSVDENIQQEAKKTPTSIDENTEQEARKTPTSIVAEDLPQETKAETPPKLEELFNFQETKQEAKKSDPKPSDIPQERRGSRRVSFSDMAKTTSSGRAVFGGGFRSNKGVKQPTLEDDHPMLGKSLTETSHPERRPTSLPQQPWLYAVFALLVLTIILRFFLTNFRFVCVLVYAALVSLLALRYVGQGPLARRQRWR